MSMLSLVYVSSATRLFSELELANLLQLSRRSNALIGITGMLLHVSGNFIQALEGEEEAVDKVYLKITADPRHHQVTTIFRRPVENRSFGEWDMGFSETSTLSPEERYQISSFINDARRDGTAPQQISNVSDFPAYLLRNFATTMR